MPRRVWSHGGIDPRTVRSPASFLFPRCIGTGQSAAWTRCGARRVRRTDEGAEAWGDEEERRANDGAAARRPSPRCHDAGCATRIRRWSSSPPTRSRRSTTHLWPCRATSVRCSDCPTRWRSCVGRAPISTMAGRGCAPTPAWRWRRSERSLGRFALHVRDPDTTVHMGDVSMAFAVVSITTNVSDLDHGRITSGVEDYCNCIRLTRRLNAVQTISGYPVEPVDVDTRLRHLKAVSAIADTGSGSPFFQPPHAQERDETAFCPPMLFGWRIGRRGPARQPDPGTAPGRLRRAAHGTGDPRRDGCMRRRARRGRRGIAAMSGAEAGP